MILVSSILFASQNIKNCNSFITKSQAIKISIIISIIINHLIPFLYITIPFKFTVVTIPFTLLKVNIT